MADTCKGKVCPKLSAQGRKVVCIEHKCAHYQHLLGDHPQTGEKLDHWDCAVNWTNILLIENAHKVREFAAAVDSARNEARTDAAAVSAALAELTAEVAGGGRPRRTLPALFGRLRELVTRKKLP